MNLAAFLIQMVKPLIAQILISLGLSVVTFAGSTTALSLLNSTLQSYIGGMPSVAANLLGLAGLGDALGILIGAFTFRLAMGSFKKITFATT